METYYTFVIRLKGYTKAPVANLKLTHAGIRFLMIGDRILFDTS